MVGITVLTNGVLEIAFNIYQFIINNSLFSSNFCVDYEGYDIFELWTLSGKV